MATHLNDKTHNKSPITLSEVSFISFLSIVFLFVLCQMQSNHGSLIGFSYWLVPDSITNFMLTQGLVNGEFSLSSFLASPGVPLFFSFFYIFGLVGFLVANIILLLINIRYYGLQSVYVSLLLYPVYLQLLVLPSKDMMVLVVYFVALYYLVKGDWKKVIIIAIVAFFIRDAAPALLLPLVAAGVIIHKTNFRPFWIVIISFILGMVVFSSIGALAGSLFVVSRNLSSFQAMSSESLHGLGFGPLGYLARVFFNLTNSAFRLTFVDDRGFISIGSLFQYISGISVLVCFFIAVRHIFKSKEKTDQLISVCYFVTLFIISINPLVQGRYLFPMSIVASVFFFRKMRFRSVIGLYVLVFLICLLGRFCYLYMNIPFPPPMEFLNVDLMNLIH